jgi:CAAX prenyl protease-like protein
MNLPLSRDAWLRIVPFAVFMLLLALRGSAPADGSWGFDPRWLYAASVLVVGVLLARFWRQYGELALQNWPLPRQLALSAGVGFIVFVLWIHLDAPWMVVGDAAAAYVPYDGDGRLDWPRIVARWLGAALLVPVMEELFWRSFLMRWIERAQFEAVEPRRVGLRAIVLSTFVFMLAHTMWLGALVAGFAYAALYVRTGTLWAPVIAHAVTNGALGFWVVATRQWQFW